MTVDDRSAENFRHVRPDPALGTRTDPVVGPVSDWTTDFSHMEPEYAQHAPEIWADLRGRCPIAHTDRFGGGWVPTRYEDVASIAYDTDSFTSRAIIMSNFRPPRAPPPTAGPPPPTHPGPAVPPRRAQAAAAGVHQERRGEAGAGHARVLRGAGRRLRRPGRRRRRRRVRPAHPDAGDRGDAGIPGRGRPAVRPVRREHPRGRQPAARGAHRPHGRALRVHLRPHP